MSANSFEENKSTKKNNKENLKVQVMNSSKMIIQIILTIKKARI